MKIDIRMDVEKLRRDMRIVQEKQIPFATSQAINACVKAAAPAVQAEMKSVFDRPTPWTLNSYRVLKYANKRSLVAVVGFKDMEQVGGRGIPAGRYLQPHMEGTARPAKGLEVLLRARGLMSNNEFLVPSKFMNLDSYGNVSRGVIQKVIANLDASRDRLTNTPKGGARGGTKKADFFFTRRGVRGARLSAIWQNYGAKGGQHAIPAFIVVTGAPKYKKKFDQAVIVERQVNLLFNSEFESAFARAIATEI